MTVYNFLRYYHKEKIRRLGVIVRKLIFVLVPQRNLCLESFKICQDIFQPSYFGILFPAAKAVAMKYHPWAVINPHSHFMQHLLLLSVKGIISYSVVVLHGKLYQNIILFHHGMPSVTAAIPVINGKP